MKLIDAFFKLALGWCALLPGVCVSAEAPPNPLLNEGVFAYENGDYEDAVNRFKGVLLASPADPVLHHWLGKSYGRLAESSRFLKALAYSRETLKYLQRAVELDEHNHDAMRDLITYYNTAPGIVGGNKKEAERLSARLQAVENVAHHTADDQESEP